MTCILLESFSGVGTSTARVLTGGFDGVGTGYGRNGGVGALLNVSQPIWSLTTTDTTVIFGIAYNPQTVGANLPGFQIGDATGWHVAWTFNADGTMHIVRPGLSVIGNTTSVVAVASSYVYIETKIKVDPTAGSVEIHVNEAQKFLATGINTKGSSTTTITRLASVTGSLNAWVDDLYVFDSLGSQNNTFYGDGTVYARQPTGAGQYSEWTPSAGSNWQNVHDATPDDDTTYNSSGTVGNRDTYGVGTLPATTSSVAAVSVAARVRKDDTASRTVAHLLRSGTTDAVGANYNPGTTYAWMPASIWETDPATSAAWTVSAASTGIQPGIKVIA